MYGPEVVSKMNFRSIWPAAIVFVDSGFRESEEKNLKDFENQNTLCETELIITVSSEAKHK